MNKYDDIVVGSGISGLTMTLLLAMSGHRVLLLEKSPHIGGSLARFSKRGIPFDTGFHFTGGLHEGGILSDILRFLGIRDSIEPIYYNDTFKNRFVFEKAGRTFEHPSGIENIKRQFKGYFPGEASAIDRYFEKILSVCHRSPSLNIHENNITFPNLDEDYISLDAVLKDLTADGLLRGLLSAFAMCYGVRPDEMSFANHSRMMLSFYESIACVKDGGDAFVNAFQKRFKEYNVEVRCGTYHHGTCRHHRQQSGPFYPEHGRGNCLGHVHFHDPPQRNIKSPARKAFQQGLCGPHLGDSNRRWVSFLFSQRSSRGPVTRIRTPQ